MGAVADRLLLLQASDKADELARVKNYLRIDHSEEDTLIRTLIDAAKDEADSYLGNDFQDEDGNDLDIPRPVASWVLGRVARGFEFRTGGLRQMQTSGVGSWTLSQGTDYSQLDLYRLLPGL